jgi:hypothetical protein
LAKDCQGKNNKKEFFMLKELERFFLFMRPAFSRRASFVWFVVVFVGFISRSDVYGVSSIIRALCLAPECYPCLLHFFHSTAWNAETLMTLWWQWLVNKKVAHRLNGRLVLIGDHTQTPKDGRKIPAVSTLHQDSETGSKPSFFRGHHWGCIALLVQAGDKYFATPLWATIQEGLGLFTQPGDAKPLSKTVQIVAMARQVAQAMSTPAYLVLDAYFAVGPVFLAAAQELEGCKDFVHILTRAKKNVVAYGDPPKRKKHQRGPHRKYGQKLKLMTLFDSKAKRYRFQKIQANIYGQKETMRYLILDLMWKPVKSKCRFILVETSRGKIILMTSNLNLSPMTAIELYCRRVTIETMFDTLKNTLGAMAYHFWSHYLSPASRSPKKNKNQKQCSSNLKQTQNTLNAIEKFVNVQLLVLGMLQLIAKQFPAQVKAKANCWLRTVSSNTPSEFVTRTALANILKNNLYGFAKDWIMRLIRQKQKARKNKASSSKAA